MDGWMDTPIAVFYSRSMLAISPSQQTRFNELLRIAKMLKDICIEGEMLLPGFTNIIGDCWAAFYGQDPHFKYEAKQLDAMQFDFLQNLMGNEHFKQWHQLTKGDELLSVLTAIRMADELKKTVENAKKQLLQQSSNFNNVRLMDFVGKQLQQIQRKLRDPSNTLAMKEVLQRQQQFYQHKRQRGQGELKQMNKQLKDLIQSINQQQIGAMIEQNKEKIRHTKQAIVAVGTMNGEKLHHLPLTDQFELAEKLKSHKELRKIADMVGRFKRIAMKKQKKRNKQTMERKNITIGQEVARLLPTELASYILPHSNLDFLRRYAEQQTFIFDTNGKDKNGKGPIIICMDESSSMTSLKEQSKAFCIALLWIAKKQKRDFAIVPFASQVGEVMIFKKGQATIQEMIHFSEQFLSGGTNYEHPLSKSLQILTESKFNEADILFVTDGSSFLSSRFIEVFNEVKRKKQFECTSIVVTNLYNAVDVNIVHKFSDRVIEVSELFEAHEAFSF